MNRIEILSRIARPEGGKIVLLVMDGVGDLRTLEQPRTPLELARTPHLDALAAAGAQGRIVPVLTGVTPGSGPGHLALFGYDPASERADIGRGALEALGGGVDFGPGDVVARGNFATVDGAGLVTDRRAGRISTAENRRLVEAIAAALAADPPEGVKVSVHSGEGHRFVLLLERPEGAEALSPAIGDTDPQTTGEAPLEPRSTGEEARSTVARLRPALATMRRALAGESQANDFLLRGFDTLPALPGLEELYGLRGGCFAGYPLYRGVARLAGMEVVDCGKAIADLVAGVAARWEDFDLFFVHFKETDKAGEDGDLGAKVRAIEALDAALAPLVARRDRSADVIAVTGDHSTPAPMKLHSWHPVPLLVNGPYCFVDDESRFDELAAARGNLGTFPAQELMGLLLANAGRLAKYGA